MGGSNNQGFGGALPQNPYGAAQNASQTMQGAYRTSPFAPGGVLQNQAALRQQQQQPIQYWANDQGASIQGPGQTNPYGAAGYQTDAQGNRLGQPQPAQQQGWPQGPQHGGPRPDQGMGKPRMGGNGHPQGSVIQRPTMPGAPQVQGRPTGPGLGFDFSNGIQGILGGLR